MQFSQPLHKRETNSHPAFAAINALIALREQIEYAFHRVGIEASSFVGNDEYRETVCVESGNVGRNKVVLAPGCSSLLRVILSSTPL